MTQIDPRYLVKLQLYNRNKVVEFAKKASWFALPVMVASAIFQPWLLVPWFAVIVGFGMYVTMNKYVDAGYLKIGAHKAVIHPAKGPKTVFSLVESPATLKVESSHVFVATKPLVTAIAMGPRRERQEHYSISELHIGKTIYLFKTWQKTVGELQHLIRIWKEYNIPYQAYVYDKGEYVASPLLRIKSGKHGEE